MTSPSSHPHRPAAAEASRMLTVINQFGIHARPAALIVKTASAYQADVYLEKDGVQVSAKSIMGLLTLEGQEGSVFRVSAVGHDAVQAVAALADLFEKRFFED